MHLETALCRKITWERWHLWNYNDHLRAFSVSFVRCKGRGVLYAP